MMTAGLALQTWLHRVPAGAKLAGLALLSVLLLPVGDWRTLVGALAMIALVYAGCGRVGMARLKLLRPLLPLLVVVGGVQAASGGWNAGAVVTMRLLAMLLLVDLVSMTTTMSALMEVLAPAFRVLRPLGVNPRKMALAVALVLRFVPVLMTRWRAREEAWKARTHRRIPPRLVAAFVADILQLADRVAEALDARGFDRSAAGNRASTMPMSTCTVAEACEVTGLGRTKIYELIGNGRLTTTTVGHRRLVIVQSLWLWLVRHQPTVDRFAAPDGSHASRCGS